MSSPAKAVKLVKARPKALKAHFEPIGGFNDEWILRIAGNHDVTRIIAAWGRGGELRNRGQQVLKMLRDYSVEQVGESSYPRHPLYLKGDLKPCATP